MITYYYRITYYYVISTVFSKMDFSRSQPVTYAVMCYGVVVTADN